jgi:hypothetical protein
MAKAEGATPFPDIEAALERELLARFPGAERVQAYGMRGWRIRRPRAVAWTHGTMDPNFLYVSLADRRQGTTLHIWNPLDWKGLSKSKVELERAGFKVMVSCLQFTRKRPYPLEAVARLLDRAARDMEGDVGQVPPYRTPRPARSPVKRVAGKGRRG